MSSRPSTYYAEPPYGPTRWQHRHGKLKIEHLNDKKSAKPDMIETAHLECASAAQPHGSTSNWVHGVYRPSRRCRSLEIEAIKVNPARNGETIHLWCGHVTQPHGNPSEHSYGVIGPIRQRGRIKFVPTSVSCKRQGQNTYLGHHQPMPPSLLARIQAQHLIKGASRPSVHKQRCGRPKFKWRNVSQALEVETTHLGCMRIAQPPEFLSKRLNGVIGLAMHQRQRSRLKLETTKVSQSPKVEMTYLECASTVQPHGNASNRLHRVYTPSCQCGRIKFEPINVSPVQNGRNTHLTRADAAQPYGSPPQCSYRVHRPRHRRG